MDSEAKGTVIIGTIFTAFGIFWMFAAKSIPIKGMTDIAGPQFLPFWAAAFMTFISSLLIIHTIMASRKRRLGGDLNESGRSIAQFDQSDEPKPQYWRTCGAMASLIFYIFLLNKLHFFFNTFIVSALGMMFAGEPLKPRLFIYAVIVSGVIYALFVILLNIPLPGSRYR